MREIAPAIITTRRTLATDIRTEGSGRSNTRKDDRGGASGDRSCPALPEHAVAVAPPDEDVDRPHPRPIHAGRPVEESLPEPRHRRGVEPNGGDSLRVPQGLIHGVLQAA